MADRITVLHICDKFGVGGSSIHGVSRLFSWWMPLFDQGKYRVRLVGLRPADHTTANLAKQGVEVLSLGKGKFDLSTVTAIVRVIRAEKADIIHLHGYGASNFGVIAAKMTGVRSIVHEHFVDPSIPPYQIPFDFVLGRMIDYGIAVSKSVKEFMVKRRFMPEKRVEVIYNGAPLGEFVPAGPREVAEERAKWGIPDGCRVVSAVGRIDTQKGYPYFIEAAAALLKDGHRLKFLVVGDGPTMDALRERCRELQIERDVIFTGYHENIPLIQSLSDIQVFPSLWEGTPLALFEAMAMRLPIVSTTVDGLGEILRDGETALLVPPRDSGRLAGAVGELLQDRDKAEALAQGAHADSKNYDIRATVEKIERVYDRLTAGE